MTNKILHIILGITALFVLPFQIVTTFVLGLLVSRTFGLLLVPISAVWMVLFLGPLIGLSYAFERVPQSRLFIAIVGIPLAFLADTYVALMPSMGEADNRYAKMVLCQTFPYTWRFMRYQRGQLNIGHLDALRADVYSRPEYRNGTYRLDW
ncbi:MAG: hypothetical protein V4550_08015 [Gemmatimonadota bacterium]